eukprot:5464201-Prymnesium_polylepis.1
MQPVALGHDHFRQVAHPLGHALALAPVVVTLLLGQRLVRPAKVEVAPHVEELEVVGALC